MRSCPFAREDLFGLHIMLSLDTAVGYGASSYAKQLEMLLMLLINTTKWENRAMGFITIAGLPTLTEGLRLDNGMACCNRLMDASLSATLSRLC